jgi:Uma2 family endonuclease
MSSATLIPVSKYLETIYRPDCDYIDGELLERNVGEREHSALQAILIGIFLEHRRDWKVFGLPELRTQVSKSNYRVPDICEFTVPETPIKLVLTDIFAKFDEMV